MIGPAPDVVFHRCPGVNIGPGIAFVIGIGGH